MDRHGIFAECHGVGRIMDFPALLVAALASAAPAGHEHHHEGGLSWSSDPWTVGVHGFVNAVYDHQGGRRGDTMSFSNSMFMAMAGRPLGDGALELRGMLSLDPAMGPRGYPLLFQTGETANGRFELIDRQHPHDFFMELGARYTQPWASGSWFAYAALPGEPALGPPAFMHRASGYRIPEAPISHHWLDSTHITMGVATLGLSQGAWMLEVSRFNGRESDEHRWDIETGPLNSSSARVTWTPAPGWSAQVSYGDIRNPDPEGLLFPALRIKRTTASVIHEGRLFDHPWATTLAWGRNDKLTEHTRYKLPAWMLESTLELRDGDAAFVRAERVTNDESSIPLTYRKASVGYILQVARTGPLRWGIGGLASDLRPAGITKLFYGDRPGAYMIFVQARF
jgi:hypothetical protein